MKKIKLAAVVSLALIFFSACAYLTYTAPETPAAPVLGRILKNKELVVGTAGSMPPLNMTTRDGEVIGLEIDMARHIAAEMGVKLRIAPMPFAELLPALENGRVDMVLSGMTINGQRNLRVAFAGPYYVTGKAFLTKIKRIASARKASEINSPETTLSVLRGSTSQRFVEESMPQAKVVPAENYDEAVSLVIQDKVNAMIADLPVCMLSVFRYPDKGLLSLSTPITYEPLGVALPPDDHLFVNWVENFIDKMKGSGQMDDLRARWFKYDSWLDRLP